MVCSFWPFIENLQFESEFKNKTWIPISIQQCPLCVIKTTPPYGSVFASSNWCCAVVVCEFMIQLPLSLPEKRRLCTGLFSSNTLGLMNVNFGINGPFTEAEEWGCLTPCIPELIMPDYRGAPINLRDWLFERVWWIFMSHLKCYFIGQFSCTSADVAVGEIAKRACDVLWPKGNKGKLLNCGFNRLSLAL
jgi:hypothetical protein